MTLPNGPAGINPDAIFGITANDGSISGLPARTQDNVTAQLKALKAAESPWGNPVGPLAQAIAGLPSGMPLPLAILTVVGRGLMDLPNKIWDSIEDLTEDLQPLLKDVPGLGSLIEIITGIEDGDENDLGTFFNRLRGVLGDPNFNGDDFDIGDFWESLVGEFINDNISIQFPQVDGLGAFWSTIVNSFLGGSTTASDVTPTEAQLAMVASAEAQLAAAVALAKLQAAQDGDTVNGLFSSDEFERLTTQTLAPGWLENYSAAKATAGWYACDGHEARFYPGSSTTTEQRCNFLRTDAGDRHTETLFQRIAYVVGTYAGSSDSSGTSRAYIRLWGRCNDSFTQGVFVDIRTSDGAHRFGYRNGGGDVYVEDGFDVVGGRPTVGATYILECGVGETLRNFRLIRNGSPLGTWNDTGNLSAAVEGVNTGWGWGARTGVAGLLQNYKRPTSFGVITVADNSPPPVPGTLLHVARVNETVVGVTGDGLRFGSGTLVSFFDTTVAKSPDMVWNPSACTLTVTRMGVYTITLTVGTNASLSEGALEYVYVVLNNELLFLGPTTRTPSSSDAALNINSARRVGVTGSTLLQPGDIVQFGIYFSVSGSVSGNASGSNSYISVVGINPLPAPVEA